MKIVMSTSFFIIFLYRPWVKIEKRPMRFEVTCFYAFLLLQDAETIERLNESGELRRILKPYKVSKSKKKNEMNIRLKKSNIQV